MEEVRLAIYTCALLLCPISVRCCEPALLVRSFTTAHFGIQEGRLAILTRLLAFKHPGQSGQTAMSHPVLLPENYATLPTDGSSRGG